MGADADLCQPVHTVAVDIDAGVGGGDAFASGLIYALHNNISPANAIETAAAAGCLDQTLEGDFCLFGINDVIDLAGGNSSGRVKR